MKSLLLLLLLAACGRTTSPYDEAVVPSFIIQHKGYYRAPFVAVNPRLRFKPKGRASLFINDIQLYVKVNLATGYSDVTHFQAIHNSERCPDLKDDFNNDGYVDGAEALSVLGPALIPLDFDIRSQFSKINMLPVTNEKGKYVYSQATSSTAVLADLRRKDNDPFDFLGKLKPGEELLFDRKAVVVYGVSEYYRLPPAVEGFGDLPASMAIPIACGIFEPTTEVFP